MFLSLSTHPQVQEKLLLSACHLLVSLATTVRPVFLISIPDVQKMFNRITDTSTQRLPDKVKFGSGEQVSALFILFGSALPMQQLASTSGAMPG